MFFRVKAAMKHLKEGAVIINTTSVTAYKGSPHLRDYSATKGAIVAFTRSLSQALAEEEDSGQRRRAWPDLDSAHPVDLSGREGGNIRQRRAAEAAWPAGGSSTQLRLPRLG